MTPTYLNPVYARDSADPFVLQHQGEFWAYSTGLQEEGGAFAILHSLDLVHWRAVGSAMAPLPGGHTCYWAPEVTYHAGLFYLYYSVGNESFMEIRVATSPHPTGPFEDSGHCLTHEQFAIDAHVFRDVDGTRYLFYATDFVDRDRVGTGTVRDVLLDPVTLAGDPKPVTLAAHDWQIYDPKRAEKGGVRWHTIEGSFVLRHKGRYYQMFSGGNWQNPSYGVGYAMTDDIARGDEWAQHIDGEQTLPLLRSIPGAVIGPGHNSVVRGPDNRQLFCVYHRWDEDHSGRQLAIDRLEWVGSRLTVLGPSHAPQPAPILPTFLDRFDEAHAEGLGPAWVIANGMWAVRDGAARQSATSGPAEARCRAALPAFVAEVSAWADGDAVGAFGLRLYGAGERALEFRLLPAERRLALRAAEREESLPLPDDFDAAAPRLLRIEVDSGWARFTLDEGVAVWEGSIAPAPAYELALFTDGMAGAFGHMSLTAGWEETWEGARSLAERGWEAAEGAEAWRIDEALLCYAPREGGAAVKRGAALDAYEWVVNARLDGDAAEGPAYALRPALDAAGGGPTLTLIGEGTRWALLWQGDALLRFPLPADFDPHDFHHFRLRKEGARLTIGWGDALLGEGRVSPEPTHVGIAAFDSPVTFDLIRLTALPLNPPGGIS